MESKQKQLHLPWFNILTDKNKIIVFPPQKISK